MLDQVSDATTAPLCPRAGPPPRSALKVRADDGLLAIKVPNGNYNHLKQKLALKLKKESSLRCPLSRE